MAVKTVKGKPFLCFDVEDTGIGIPPEKHEAIFDMFTQGESGTTRKYGGTGLGLTITRRLVELLDGTFSFTSEKGKGSIFSITIPAGIDMKSVSFLDNDELEVEPALECSPKETSAVSGRILLAEDDKGCQILAQKTLENLGLEITIVENGNEVIEIVNRQSFDLILLDIQMPELNGYQTAEKLKENGVTTPIVAMTAYAMVGDREKCIEAGCVDYISKPVEHELLLEILDKYLTAEDKV